MRNLHIRFDAIPRHHEQADLDDDALSDLQPNAQRDTCTRCRLLRRYAGFPVAWPPLPGNVQSLMRALRRPTIITTVLCTVFLTGCGSSVPSESDGRSVLENRTSGGGGFSGSAIRVANFRQTDGQEREVHGVRMYRMSYEAELECLERPVPQDFLNICAGRNAGDIVTRSGTLSFEETERGWKGQDGESY